MSETRKLAAILVSDVVGYSRLAGADEDRILARFRTLRSDLIDPTIAVHHGRMVKRTGDGSIVEFRLKAKLSFGQAPLHTHFQSMARSGRSMRRRGGGRPRDTAFGP
jgi:class 3 adenylate cyclase